MTLMGCRVREGLRGLLARHCSAGTWYTRQLSNQLNKHTNRRLLRRRGATDMESLRGPGGDLDHDEQATARLMAEGNERVRRHVAAKDNEERDGVRAEMWAVVLAASARTEATSPSLRRTTKPRAPTGKRGRPRNTPASRLLRQRSWAGRYTYARTDLRASGRKWTASSKWQQRGASNMALYRRRGGTGANYARILTELREYDTCNGRPVASWRETADDQERCLLITYTPTAPQAFPGNPMAAAAWSTPQAETLVFPREQ